MNTISAKGILNSPDASIYKKRWVLVLIIAAGLLVTFWLFQEIRLKELDTFRRGFESNAAIHSHIIESQLKEDLLKVETLVRLFQASELVEPHEFRAFTQPLLFRTQEMSAIAWVPAVPKGEVRKFQESASGLHHRQFRIFERGPDRNAAAPEDRGVYYPIFYIESTYPGYRENIGFNMGSVTEILAGFQKAITTGKSVMCTKTDVMMNGRPAVAIIVPCHRKDFHLETGGTKALAIQGFAVAIVQEDSLKAYLLKNMGTQDAVFALHDVSNPQDAKPIVLGYPDQHTKGSWRSPFLPPPPEFQRSFELADLTLRAEIVAAHSYMERNYPLTFWLILPAGLMLTLMLALYISSMLSQRELLKKTVAERTEKLQLSEEKYRLLVENANEAIFVVQDGAFLFVNTKCCEILGYTREEILNSGMERYIHPEDRAMVVERHAKRLRGEDLPHSYSFRILNRAGIVLWVEVNAVLIPWAGRIATQSFLTDITEQKKAEETLRTREEHLRTIFENAEEIIHLIAWDGTFLYISPSWERYTGFPVSETVGKSFVPYVHPDDQAACLELVKKVYETGQPHKISEFRVKHASGKWIWFMNSGTAVKDAQGNLLYFSGVATDVTERKRAEEKLLLIQKAVENSSDAIGISDPRGKHYYQNKAFTDLLGYAAEELGEAVQQIVFADQDTARHVFETIMRGGSCIQEVEYIRKDGRRLTVLLRADAIKDETGKTIGLVSISTDITERKHAEESLSKSERKFSSTFHLNPSAMAISDIVTSKFIDVNEAFTSQTGYSREEIIGKSAEDLQMWVNPDDRKQIINTLKEKGEVKSTEVLMRVKNDNIRNVLFSARFIEIEQDHYLLTFALDISERKRLQEQLLQSQKLEAVGILAGGVAHDFNNILGAIIGYAEITMDKMATEDPLRKNLGKILDAAQRSSNITRQLLAFARKQVIAPVLLDLNESVETTLKMIRRLIGENIELTWSPATSPCKVMMDPSQLDQVLLNLCVNARDAIGGIGRITIETDIVSFDEDYCLSHGDITTGKYIQLSVSDNGCGMDKETQKHIFEPFFTTKSLGQGTGMGLATVYGIVKQNKGFIHVYSEPGAETTFKIYIPLYAGETPTVSKVIVQDLPRSRGETILMVEDDPMILEMSLMMLKNLGYSVLSAATPGEAIRIVREHCSEIHLFITDVVLPEMNGRDLAKQILAIRPMIKHLFMSGYTANVIAHQGILDEGVNFIQKPFLLKDLATKIREVMD